MQEITTAPNWPEVLSAVFTDPRFREVHKNYLVGVVDGLAVEVAIAFRNPAHPNFLLSDLDRTYLLTSRWTGDIHAGFVVAADITKLGERVYVGSAKIEEIDAKLGEPIQLKRGDYCIVRERFLSHVDDIL
jgi:hypothetical protein